MVTWDKIRKLHSWLPATSDGWHQHKNGGGWVQDTATVEDDAFVGEFAVVSGSAWVCDSAMVSGSAVVCDSAMVSGSARVSVSARVSDSAWVSGSARVSGSAWVIGSAWVSGSAVVCVQGDHWSLSGLEYDVTYTRSDDSLVIGCHRKTVDEWIRTLNNPHKDAPMLERALRAMFADRLEAAKAAGGE